MIAYTLFDTSPLAGGHLSAFISFSSWYSAIILHVFVVYWDWNCLCTSYRRSCNHMQTTPIVRPLWGLVKSIKSNPYDQKSHWSYPYPIAVHSPGTTRGPGLDLLRRCATSRVFTVAGLPGRHGTGFQDGSLSAGVIMPKIPGICIIYMYFAHIYMCKVVRLDIYVESLHNIVICVKECYDMLCLDDVRSKPSALRETFWVLKQLAQLLQRINYTGKTRTDSLHPRTPWTWFGLKVIVQSDCTTAIGAFETEFRLLFFHPEWMGDCNITAPALHAAVHFARWIYVTGFDFDSPSMASGFWAPENERWPRMVEGWDQQVPPIYRIGRVNISTGICHKLI